MRIQNKRPVPPHLAGDRQDWGTTGSQQPLEWSTKPEPCASSYLGSGGGQPSDAARSGQGSKERYRSNVPRVTAAFEKTEPVDEKNKHHHFAWNESKRDDGLPDEATVYYRGTSAHSLPYIMAHGFRPSFGAGADHLFAHYRVGREQAR